MKLQLFIKWIMGVIIAVFIIYSSINAQTNLKNIYYPETSKKVLVDTSDFFPLQDGNRWDLIFNGISETDFLSWEVMGDTLMPNDNFYKYIIEKKNYSLAYEYFFRKDSNKIYSYYGDSIACVNREYKFLDFFLPDSSVWSICRDLGPGEGNARGIAATYYDYTYYTFFNKPLETKRFEDVFIDSTDTLWTPGEGSIPMWFAKGIGPVRIFIFQGGDFWLQGAIIDGQQFGTLVSVENELNTTPASLQIQSYPNPFNGFVNFKITLPKSGITELTLYNILGEKVSTIINEYRNSGNHDVKFNTVGLTSGIYLAVLHQGTNSSVQKIILLK